MRRIVVVVVGVGGVERMTKEAVVVVVVVVAGRERSKTVRWRVDAGEVGVDGIGDGVVGSDVGVASGAAGGGGYVDGAAGGGVDGVAGGGGVDGVVGGGGVVVSG